MSSGNGIKDRGVHLDLCYFEPKSGLNEEHRTSLWSESVLSGSSTSLFQVERELHRHGSLLERSSGRHDGVEEPTHGTVSQPFEETVSEGQRSKRTSTSISTVYRSFLC